jgi:hypothetical protein
MGLIVPDPLRDPLSSPRAVPITPYVSKRLTRVVW